MRVFSLEREGDAQAGASLSDAADEIIARVVHVVSLHMVNDALRAEVEGRAAVVGQHDRVHDRMIAVRGDSMKTL